MLFTLEFGETIIYTLGLRYAPKAKICYFMLKKVYSFEFACFERRISAKDADGKYSGGGYIPPSPGICAHVLGDILKF